MGGGALQNALRAASTKVRYCVTSARKCEPKMPGQLQKPSPLLAVQFTICRATDFSQEIFENCWIL